jgi:hypothetical protein
MAFQVIGLSDDQVKVIRNAPEPPLALLVFLCRPMRDSLLWLDIPVNLEVLCHRSKRTCVVCPQSACLVWCLHVYQFGLPPACTAKGERVLTCRSVVAAGMMYMERSTMQVAQTVHGDMSYEEYVSLREEIKMLKRRLTRIGGEGHLRFSWHKTIDLYPRDCHARILEVVADWKALYTAIYEGSGYTEGELVSLRTLTGPVGKHHGLYPIRRRLVAYMSDSVLGGRVPLRTEVGFKNF